MHCSGLLVSSDTTDGLLMDQKGKAKLLLRLIQADASDAPGKGMSLLTEDFVVRRVVTRCDHLSNNVQHAGVLAGRQCTLAVQMTSESDSVCACMCACRLCMHAACSCSCLIAWESVAMCCQIHLLTLLVSREIITCTCIPA